MLNLKLSQAVVPLVLFTLSHSVGRHTKGLKKHAQRLVQTSYVIKMLDITFPLNELAIPTEVIEQISFYLYSCWPTLFNGIVG